MPFKKIPFLFRALIIVLFGILALGLGLSVLVHHPPFQRYVLSQISTTVGYDIRAEKISILLSKGVGVVAQNAFAVSHTGRQEFEASSVTVYFDAGELLSGNMVPRRLLVKNPGIKLAPEKKDAPKFRVGRFFSREFPTEHLSRLDAVVFENARIHVVGIPYRFEGIDLTLAPPAEASSGLKLDLDGRVRLGEHSGRFKASGTIGPAREAPDAPLLDVMLTLEDIPLALIPRTRPVSFEQGDLQMKIRIKAPLAGPLQVEGDGTGRNVRFSIFRKNRQKTYGFPRLDMRLTGDYRDRVIRISSSSLGNGDFHLDTTLKLDFGERSNPVLHLGVTSPAMTLADFKMLFPTALLPPWLEQRLFPVFTGGRARLERFSLEGKVGDIRNLGQAQNAHVLSLHLDLADMTALKLAGGLPIEKVGGRLGIQNGRLNVSGVTGTFGSSAIHDGNLDVPSLYVSPAQLLIGLKGKFDLADLRQQGRIDMLPQALKTSIQALESTSGTVISHIRTRFQGPRWGVRILDGEFQFAECRIARDQWPFPLKIKKGHLKLGSDGAGRYSATGTWGKSTYQVSGDLRNVLQKGRPSTASTDLDATLKTVIDLAGLHAFREADLLPAQFRNQLNRLDSVSGKAAAEVRLVRKAGWPYPKILKAGVEFSDCRLGARELGFPLHVDQANLSLKEDGSADLSATGVWGRSTFRAFVNAPLEEAQGKPGKEGTFHATGITARIETEAFLKEIFNRFLPNFPRSLQFPGKTRGVLYVEKRNQAWALRGDIGLENMRFEKAAFSMDPPGADDKLIFDIGIDANKAVNLRNLIWRVGNSTVEASAYYDPYTQEGIPFNVAMDPLFLQDLGVRDNRGNSHPAGGQLNGRAQGQIQGRLDLSAPWDFQLDGHLAIEKFFIGGRASIPPLEGRKVHLNFHGKKIDLTANDVVVGKNVLDIAAQLQGWRGVQGEITATADEVDLTDALKQIRSPGEAKEPLREAVFFEDSRIKISFSTARVKWKDRTYGALSGVCTLSPGRLDIENIRLQPDRGDIKVWGHVNAHPEKDIYLLSHIKFDKTPLEDLFLGLGLDATKFEGKMSLDGALLLRGAEFKNLLTGMSGGFNVEMVEGQIKRSHIFLKILEFLSLEKIFIQKPPDLSREGLYYKSIKGYVRLNRGIITTEGMVMKSPVINAVIKGSFDPISKRIDAELAVQPLGTIDFIISKIPIVGHILTGKEKTILVYYFNAKGSLDKPKVRFRPFKNLGQGTLNTFKRLILTPGRLFIKISTIIKNLESGNLGVPADPRKPDQETEGP